MFLFADQSTNRSGICLFTAPYELYNYQIIDLSYMDKDNQVEKRYEFLKQLKDIVLKNNVQIISTEGVYFNNNASSFMKLAKMQGCIEDWARANNIVCYSWKCAGEWRKWISVKSKKREDYKRETREYILAHYDIKDKVEKIIFDKYHTEKHLCFDDLSKEIKDIQFDITDAIAMGDAYFKMIENLGEASE
jgi:hypothetical protein